jgi:hypothetical protein
MGYPLYTSDNYPVYSSDNCIVDTSDTVQTNLVAKAIRLLTKGRIAYTPEGSTTHEDLNDLIELLKGEITRNNPGFTGFELARFTACFVLDSFENSSGNGQIIEKTVNDTRWKVAPAQTSSYWRDEIHRMIAEFRMVSAYPKAYMGVERSDADMKALRFDNTGSPQYGNPNRREW